MTAAHCFQEKYQSDKIVDLHDVKVLLGAHDIKAKSEVGRVEANAEEIGLHCDWDSSDHRFNHDIAIITLRGTVNFNNFIQPVCLLGDLSLNNISTGEMAGWGPTESESEEGIKIARKIKIPILSNEDCYRENYLIAKSSWKESFCAGMEGQGVCQGDSGSGFYINHGGRYFLKGLVSFALGGGACSGNYVAVYTNAHDYLSFLKGDELLFDFNIF